MLINHHDDETHSSYGYLKEILFHIHTTVKETMRSNSIKCKCYANPLFKLIPFSCKDLVDRVIYIQIKPVFLHLHENNKQDTKNSIVGNKKKNKEKINSNG